MSCTTSTPLVQPLVESRSMFPVEIGDYGVPIYGLVPCERLLNWALRTQISTMRLVHTSTLELHEFFNSKSDGYMPRYAILSHTWEDGEITFQQYQKGEGRNKQGHQKVVSACEIARRYGCDYLWADTCCIDKTSSAELSEAVSPTITTIKTMLQRLQQFVDSASICSVPEYAGKFESVLENTAPATFSFPFLFL